MTVDVSSLSNNAFYITGGTLPPDAASYVERQADKDLLTGLLMSEYCYVLNSRQMGKSSLMVRTAGRYSSPHQFSLRLAKIAQPLVQIGASFPANLIFLVVVLAVLRLHANLTPL